MQSSHPIQKLSPKVVTNEISDQIIHKLTEELQAYEKRLAKNKKINKKEYQKAIGRLAAKLKEYSRENFLNYDNFLNISTDKNEMPPSHSVYSNYSDNLTNSVVQEILSQPTQEQAEVIYHRWVMIMDILHKEMDFSSAQAIIGAIDNVIVEGYKKDFFYVTDEEKEMLESWEKERVGVPGAGYNNQVAHINADKMIIPYMGALKSKITSFKENSAASIIAGLVLKLAQLEILVKASEKDKEITAYDGNIFHMFSSCSSENYLKILEAIRHLIKTIDDTEKQAEMMVNVEKILKAINVDNKTDNEKLDDLVKFSTIIDNNRQPFLLQQEKIKNARAAIVVNEDEVYQSLLGKPKQNFEKLEKDKITPMRIDQLSEKLVRMKKKFEKNNKKYKQLRSRNPLHSYQQGQAIPTEMVIEIRYQYVKMIYGLLEELGRLDAVKSKTDLARYTEICNEILAIKQKMEKDKIMKHHLNKKRLPESTNAGLRANISLANKIYQLNDWLMIAQQLVGRQIASIENAKEKKKEKQRRSATVEIVNKRQIMPPISKINIPTARPEEKTSSEEAQPLEHSQSLPADILRSPKSPRSEKIDAMVRKFESSRSLYLLPEALTTPRSPKEPTSPTLRDRVNQFQIFQSGNVPTSGSRIRLEQKEIKEKATSQKQIPTARKSSLTRADIKPAETVSTSAREGGQEDHKLPPNSPRYVKSNLVTPRTPTSPSGEKTIKAKTVNVKKRPHLTDTAPVSTRGSLIRDRVALTDTAPADIKLSETTVVRTTSHRKLEKESVEPKKKKKHHGTVSGHYATKFSKAADSFGSVRFKHRKKKKELEMAEKKPRKR